MSHASHHNILTGTKEVEGKEKYSHIVSVRNDKLEAWLNKGYVVIERSEDACLIGKKTEETLKKEKEVAEWLEAEAKENAKKNK